MALRFRGKQVQFVRPVPGGQGRQKFQVVGVLSRSRPEIDDTLRAACTPEELAELEAWVDHYNKLDLLRAQHAAVTLPEHMALAAEWLKTATPEQVAPLADDILQTWARLKKTLAVSR